MITLKVTDQGISSVSESLRSVVGSVNVERVKFEFDESWSDLTRFACFRNKVEFHVLLDDSNECNIPWEVLTNEGTLCVGALGMDGDTVVKPTLWVKYSDVFIGTDPEGAGTTEHTKSALEQMIQIQEETKQIAEDLQEAAESGEFDGKPGYTPIRGKDYWTSEDQQFIVDEATKQVGPLVDEAKTAAEDATAAKESIENMGVSAESVPYDEPAEVEKTVEEDVVNLHFKIPRGKTGNSGVHYGSDKPTDPNTNVWINPEGETDESYYNKTVAAAKRAESSAQSAQQASDDAKAYSESAALSKTSAEEAAQSASTSAQSASTDATTASQAASTATSAKESAAQSAQQASGAASSASTSAGAASSSAQEAGEAATKAEGHASDAQSSANLASGAATTATQANTEAQSAAQSASTSASQATTAASTAQDHATAADAAKTAAEQAATTAGNAQAGAEQAAQSAEETVGQATQAAQEAKDAAQAASTAQTGAAAAEYAAQGHALDADTARTQAQTAATEAEESKSQAETAAKNAEEYAKQALASVLPNSVDIPDDYILKTMGGFPVWGKVSEFTLISRAESDGEATMFKQAFEPVEPGIYVVFGFFGTDTPENKGQNLYCGVGEEVSIFSKSMMRFVGAISRADSFPIWGNVIFSYDGATIRPISGIYAQNVGASEVGQNGMYMTTPASALKEIGVYSQAGKNVPAGSFCELYKLGGAQV